MLIWCLGRRSLSRFKFGPAVFAYPIRETWFWGLILQTNGSPETFPPIPSLSNPQCSPSSLLRSVLLCSCLVLGRSQRFLTSRAVSPIFVQRFPIPPFRTPALRATSAPIPGLAWMVMLRCAPTKSLVGIFTSAYCLILTISDSCRFLAKRRLCQATCQFCRIHEGHGLVQAIGMIPAALLNAH